MSQVLLEYLGHSAFHWTTPNGMRILVDPYGQPYEFRPATSYGHPPAARWFKSELPLVDTDIVLVTHPHFDHDAVHRVVGLPTIVRDPVRLEGNEFIVTGYLGEHAGPYGAEFNKRNIAYTIETGGVTFCHLGDNKANLPSGLIAASHSIDVLIVPVDDGCHLMSFDDVDKIIDAVDPLVVIPMHYHSDGITDPVSKLKPIDAWLSGQRLNHRLFSKTIKFSREAFPNRIEIWVARP